MNWRLLTYLSPEGFSLKMRSWAVYTALFAVLLSGLWVISGTGVGHLLGFDGARTRVESGIKAGYWAYRAMRGNENVKERGLSFRGYIDRAQGDLLLVYLYQGKGRKRLIVRLANVREGSVNVEGFAKRYRGQNLQFDVYRLPYEKYARAVIWQRDKPLNLEVIERAGGAELNPPTNVVDKVFARYYWRMAISGA